MSEPRLRTRTQSANRKKRQETWVEATIDSQWRVAYRLAAQEGRTVVAELRVFPSDKSKKRPAGTWGQHLERVPRGGLTARLIRKISFADFARFAGTTVASQYGGDTELQPPKDDKRQQENSRRGRPPRPDQKVAGVAELYSKQVRSGTLGVILNLSTLTGEKESTIRDIIHQARKRGLLTPTHQGRGGGQLTDKAKRLLKTVKR